MPRGFCLGMVTLLSLAACSQASGPTSTAIAHTSPSAATPTAAHPSPLSTPSPLPTTKPIKLASDSYPSAPHVNSVYLGNGVYGNALVLSFNDAGAWYWDGRRWIVS